jgi:hypothetical protein
MAKVTENELRSAKPRLLVDCIQDKNVRGRFRVNPYISDVDLGWDECLREGFDPDGRTGLGPVYRRVVMRAGEVFYLSTYKATREQVMKGWGSAGLAYCDPITGTAMARVETKLESQIEKRSSWDKEMAEAAPKVP